MIPFHIMAAAAAVAAKQAEREALRRIELGLPPIESKPYVEPKSDAGDVLFWVYFIIGGLIFCAPWWALIYAAIKVAFAVHGQKWP